MDNELVISLISKFISGEEISLSLANRIEVILDAEFSDDEMIQDAALMLASYRPGGGEYLFDYDQVAPVLSKVLEKLKSIS
jgi:hypothetical protein